jgi:2-oxo-4-hydroxy-4-carboxy-5-ureidoimidazoline decarboxylase
VTDTGLARFNELPVERAAADLAACCASPAWTAGVLAGRPYADRADLLACSRRLLAELDWAEVRRAVDAHPRIGERVAGPGREADWSRREQSGMDHAEQDVRMALVEANRAYEERFGHVFLIFATGRTDVEMLAAARLRVGNDDDTEREVVRAELGLIVGRRLTVLMESWKAAP